MKVSSPIRFTSLLEHSSQPVQALWYFKLFSLVLANINHQMSAVLVYKQPIYTEVDFTEMELGSATEALPHMFLTVSGVARIASQKLQQSKSEGLQPFPHWKYHVGEFTQWLDGQNHVFPPTLLIQLSS
jgi:hypothetical protein